MASPEQMAETMRNNIADKTGKDFNQWQEIIKKSGLDKHGLIVKMLKTEHAVTHGFANLISHDHLHGSEQASDESLLESQYQKKAQLKPIYDELIKLVTAFGPGIEVSVKKSYVSLRHKKQFAIIQPSTQKRVDVGLNLKGMEPTERLEASGSFNAMVSHRVRIEQLEQVDKQLTDWLELAFNKAG